TEDEGGGSAETDLVGRVARQVPHQRDGVFVGGGIGAGRVGAVPAHHAVVDETVLGGDLAGGQPVVPEATSAASRTTTSSPARCSSTAVVRPVIPAPAMTTSAVTSPASGGNSGATTPDRKSTRLNSSHVKISYAVFCLKKKKQKQ